MIGDIWQGDDLHEPFFAFISVAPPQFRAHVVVPL